MAEKNKKLINSTVALHHISGKYQPFSKNYISDTQRQGVYYLLVVF